MSLRSTKSQRIGEMKVNVKENMRHQSEAQVTRHTAQTVDQRGSAACWRMTRRIRALEQWKDEGGGGNDQAEEFQCQRSFLTASAALWTSNCQFLAPVHHSAMPAYGPVRTLLGAALGPAPLAMARFTLHRSGCVRSVFD